MVIDLCLGPSIAAPLEHGLSPFAGEGFDASVRVRGENVSVTPEPYNGTSPRPSANNPRKRVLLEGLQGGGWMECE